MFLDVFRLVLFAVKAVSEKILLKIFYFFCFSIAFFASLFILTYSLLAKVVQGVPLPFWLSMAGLWVLTCMNPFFVWRCWRLLLL